ncbi:MAG: hypothetical protein DIZ80_12635 [endosymbiont of Galathealinum brachiosum]|uniref:histidine kinase n=1 Tax=endosymbiont of Galathealinum brachiosum TaxID=2200906 RepID=A0A370DFK1_9GAMM|nr:MAG: hypothetical protein DIZ80_12635 [endosymbiont of Galathealinum brachiosum]
MKYSHSDLKKEVLLLSSVDKRLTLSFGVLILALMIGVMVVSGINLSGVMDREEKKLSRLFTHALATSVSRVSFSGRHHVQLLLEETQKEYSDIKSLITTDLEGYVIASSIKEKNGTELEGRSKEIAINLLANKNSSYMRYTTFNGEPVIEITLPYSGGFNNEVQGVVQINLSTLKKEQDVKNGIVLIAVMVALLLGISIVVVRKISLYFSSPIRYLASDMAATLCAIPDMLFELDIEGRFIHVMANNEERLHELNDYFHGKKASEIFSTEDSEIVMLALEEANKTGESHGHQISLEMSDKLFWYEISIARKKYELVESARFIVISRDITERKKIEKELYEYREHLEELVQDRTLSMRAACEEAEQANSAKSEFLSRMSHELRTPMNAVLGFAQVLEMDIDENNKSQRESVKEILDAGYHLLELINEVLDLSRIESGKLDIKIETIYADWIIDQCIALIKPQANQKNINIIDCAGKEKYKIHADHVRFKQVMLNIMSNAVKYNHESGSITLECHVTEKQKFRISITSTGKALSNSEINKIFTPFERLGVSDGIEGTGIGLVISKHLVDAMGGSIGIESSELRGNTFWVDLPLDET